MTFSSATSKLSGLSVKRTGYNQIQGRTLAQRVGSGAASSSRKSPARRGAICWISAYTPDAYANNLDYLKIDPSTVDALIMSHGHYDHCGGLIGFLEAQRDKMRKDLRLYTGGEDNFCHRMLRAPDGNFVDYGPMIDRSPVKGAGRRACPVGGPGHYRGPCLHHRRGPSDQHRACIAE